MSKRKKPGPPEKPPRDVIPTRDDFANQANQISRASYRIPVLLRRLIFLAMAHVQAEDDKEMWVSMSVGDVVRALDLGDHGVVYDRIREAVDGAMSYVIHIDRGGGSWTKFQWLSRADYDADTDTVRLRIHQDLQPYVLKVQRDFSQLRISEFAKLQGRHSQRLYELVMAASGHAGRNGNRPGEWFIQHTIPEIRWLFGIEENEYTRTNDLRKRVIDAPVKEINEADLGLRIKPEYLRKSKALRGVRYHCKWLRRDDPVPVDPATMSEEQEREMIAENPELYEECLQEARKQMPLPFINSAETRAVMEHRAAVAGMVERLKQKKGRKKT